MTTLTKKIEDLIRAEGEKAYPDECCGCLLGEFTADGALVAVALPVDNAREKPERRRRFVITPEDFLKTERAALRLGLEVVGFYHSHPDCSARPSDYDREHALPAYAYVIVSVKEGQAKDMTSWVLSPDRETFAEKTIAIKEA